MIGPSSFSYEPMAVAPELVKLNVGGTRYLTTRGTLVAAPFFRAMFSDDMLSPVVCFDQEGCLFIDRNGAVFSYVLQVSWLSHETGCVTKICSGCVRRTWYRT